MNGWLVLGRCGMDDVPMRLFAGEKQARDFASRLNEDDVLAAVRAVLRTDASEAICIALVEFIEGVPAEMIVIHSFVF